MAKKHSKKQRTTPEKAVLTPQEETDTAVMDAPETQDTLESPTPPFKQKSSNFWIIVLMLLSAGVLYIYANGPLKETLEAPTPAVQAPIPSLLLRKAPPAQPAVLSDAVVPDTEELPIEEEVPAFIEEQEILQDDVLDPAIEEQAAQEIKTLQQTNRQQTVTSYETLRLVSAMMQGRPFYHELRTALATNPDDLTLQEIEARFASYAMTGISTRLELVYYYKDASDMALSTFYIKKGPMTWQENIAAFFKSLVQVRKVDIKDRTPQGPDILYKAGDYVSTGDLEKALQTLALLEPAQKIQMAAFISDASARIELDHLFDMPLMSKGE